MPRPRARRVITKLELDRIDIVDRGANHDLDSNDGAHILLMKRAPENRTTIAPDTLVPFSRETIAGWIDSALQKGRGIMNDQNFTDEHRAWQDDRTIENEVDIINAIIQKASRIAKSASGGRQPWEVIEKALFDVAADLQERDPRLGRHEAIVEAARLRPELRQAASEARRGIYSRIANE
jgi:hypothetical protein